MKLLAAIICIFITLILVILSLDKRKRTQLIKKYKNEYHDSGKLEKIDGIDIYYHEVGEGIPILIIHGFMGSTIEFDETAEALSKNFKVIVVELLGFGRSDKRENLDYSKKNMAEVIAKLLQKKGYKKIHVLGHSMGGEVALNLALNHKKAIKSLVLVDSVGYIDIRWPPIPNFFLKYIFKMYYFQKLCYMFCFYNKSLYNSEKFERQYLLNYSIPSKTLKVFSRRNDKHRITEKIPEIQCPTLIIWGRHDKVVPLENAYKFNNDIKDSKLIIFENSGHLPYNEEQNKFIDSIENFLKANN